MHSENTWHSLEYGHLHVYGMDGSWMPDTVHQLDRMERKHG
jgi:hypothetical protein